jgi:LmbE family N-acetylglucosaminyl deacetylase
MAADVVEPAAPKKDNRSMMEFWEGWENPKRILAIFAHPDDPEFFCGATIARWIEHGHHVTYCIMTRGDKGSHDPNVIPANWQYFEKKSSERLHAFWACKPFAF